MKILRIVLSLAGLALSLPAGATPHANHPFGAGVVLGEPTGLSAKYWLGTRPAVDFGLGYSFNDFVFVYADYLHHFPGVLGTRERFLNQLAPYVGVGAIFLASTASGRLDGRYFTGGGSSAGLGLRVPVGLEWCPSDPRLGVFLELVPGVGIVPSTFAFLEGGIGARFYF